MSQVSASALEITRTGAHQFTLSIGAGNEFRALFTRSKPAPGSEEHKALRAPGMSFHDLDKEEVVYCDLRSHGELAPAPRSSYRPHGRAVLGIPVPPIRPAERYAHREDWRLLGTGLYGGMERMMTERQWSDFVSNVLLPVIDWCVQYAPSAPPSVPDATLMALRHARRRADSAYTVWEAAQATWLSALDSYSAAMDVVQKWHEDRGIPAPQLSLAPTP